MERQSITFELEHLKNGPSSESWTTDLVHQAAYRENTLGLPLLCPEENILELEPAEIREFMTAHYVPSRIVLAGVNVDHNQFVELAQNWFGKYQPSEGVRDTRPIDDSISQYTGGEVKVRLGKEGRWPHGKEVPTSSAPPSLSRWSELAPRWWGQTLSLTSLMSF